MKFIFRMLVTIGILVLVYALYLRSEGRQFDTGREIGKAQRVASGAWDETKSIAARAHDEYEAHHAADSQEPDDDTVRYEEPASESDAARSRTPFAELIGRLNRAVARLNGRDS